LVVLANSIKHGGRCVAGKALAHDRLGAWVRPVSTDLGGALSDFDRWLTGGGQLAVLDIVDVPFSRPAPHAFQKENHRIALGAGWVRRGRLNWASLGQAVDACDALWLNGYSSGGGCNDRIPADRLDEVDSSLRLIGPVRVDLLVLGARVRARFVHQGTVYNLSVTDPWIRASYARLRDGWYRLYRTFLCLSLAPVWNGYAYKLASAIILPDAD
jgi:hypothetical protein